MEMAIFHHYGRFGYASETGSGTCSQDEIEKVSAQATKIVTFDCISLGRDMALPWPKTEDVMLMASLLKARIEHSILALSMEELGYGGAEDFALHQTQKGTRPPDEVICRYLEKTARNVLALYNKWYDRIPPKPYQIDMKTACVLSYMEQKAIEMNPEAFFQIKSDLKRVRLRIEDEINTLVGKAVNPRSHQQVRRLLQARGVKTSGTTGKREMSTATKYLQRFAEDDLVRGILDWRKVEHVAKTSLPKIEDGIVGGERLYVKYSLGTRLGEIQPKPVLIERGPCEPAMCSLIRIPRGKLCLVEYSLKELDNLLRQHMDNESNRRKAMWAAKNYGCVTLTSGRKIWVDSREVWKALELWILGTRADYIKKLVVELASAGHCPYFLLHDGIFILQDSSASYSEARNITQKVLGVDTYPLEW